jgi:hypothetical protein
MALEFWKTMVSFKLVLPMSTFESCATSKMATGQEKKTFMNMRKSLFTSGERFLSTVYCALNKHFSVDSYIFRYDVYTQNTHKQRRPQIKYHSAPRLICPMD